MANEPARARLFWAISSLGYPVPFRHTTTCRSRALTFSAAIHFAMKRSTPCSAVSGYLSSSWAVVVYWSAWIPKAPRSSRKHTIHFFPGPSRSPRPPIVLRTSRTLAVFCPPKAPQIPQSRYGSLCLIASMLSLPVFMTMTRLQIELSV